MTAALFLAFAATATPVPTQQETPPADLVSPGLWGAVALFFLALAVYFLGRSMARRVRRVNQRAQVQAELEQEEREQEEREQQERERAEAAARQRDPGRGPDPT